MQKEKLNGSLLEENMPPRIDDSGYGEPTIHLYGESNDRYTDFKMNSEILSRHLMLIGGTGCGKTNTFFHIVSQLKDQMDDNDVMIIFDTKGDYYERFFDKGRDCVLSTAEKYRDLSVAWNVFEEILVDGTDPYTLNDNISEICWGLFSEAINKNTSNPFFPNAARDMLSAILTCIFRKTGNGNGQELQELYLNNAFLKTYLNTLSVKELRELLENQSDQVAVMSYVGDGNNDQGLGVFAELQSVIRKIFVSSFAENGDFSIRSFVRNKGAKALFIEYDLTRGSMLTPIYKLLIDLALKEAMSRKEGERGNVYLFCDEFKLLPDLLHIENAVNFGRSLGLKVFAGLQSIDQITESYGEARGKNIIAGFSSVFSFRANDEATRQFTVGKYGKNYIIEQYDYEHKDKRIGNVVEDWDLGTLKKGEAVVGLTDHEPFKFRFELFR
ncbi:MAG: type IV secretion system DNA-binding domain-containing protein [Clostridia bacterium]|nr:type IV secretion system DNA-binding domain-containing protein [Clostridia bacterium]